MSVRKEEIPFNTEAVEPGEEEQAQETGRVAQVLLA